MFENKRKKWYGSYSRAGKFSAENFYAITHKDNIFKREKKRVKSLYEFKKNDFEYIEENINFQKLFEQNFTISNTISSPKKIKKYENIKDKIEDKFRNIYNKKYKPKNKIYIEPSCTKYNPNYDYIHKKLISGPKWDDLLGRNNKIQNMENTTFYLTSSNLNKKRNSNKNKNNKNKDIYNTLFNFSKKKIKKLKNKRFSIVDTGESKCLVNMNITTQRGEPTTIYNLKIRTDKPFIKKEKTKMPKHLLNNNNHKSSNKEKKINENNLKVNYCLTEDNIKRNNDLKIIKNKSKIKINSSYNSKIRKNLKLQLGKNNIPNIQTETNFYSPLLNILSKITSDIYEVPDISKATSQEQRENIKSFTKRLMPKTTLNYNLVLERPLSMVVYKKTDKKKDKKIEKRKKILGIDPNLNFDINKIINKYNNHCMTEAPNFNCMTSRPNDKSNPLPNFMQKMFNRMSVNSYNDKALQLNGYSEGKFLSSINSFFPKESFNKIINLSLLRGKDMRDEIMKKYNEKQIEKIISKIGNKNYEKIILDGALDKFDKITFKTDNKKKKFNKALLKRLLLNENETENLINIKK